MCYKVYLETEDLETAELIKEFSSYDEAVEFVKSKGATTMDFRSLLGHSESWCDYSKDDIDACYTIVW